MKALPRPSRGNVPPLRLGSAFAALAVVLLAAGCVGTVPTEVKVQTFRVPGSNLEAALANLGTTHGPKIGRTGKRAVARVQLKPGNTFRVVETPSGCRFNRDGEITLAATVTVPDWRPGPNVTAEERKKWNLVRRYAEIHEQAHIRIHQKYAARMTAGLRRLSAPDCEQLAAKAKRLITAERRQARIENDRYDATDKPRFRAYLRRNGYIITS